MHEGVMQHWLDGSHLSANSMVYVEQMYESFLDDPTSVTDEWREIFDHLPKVEGVSLEAKHSDVRELFAQLAKTKNRTVVSESDQADAKQVKVLQLINAFRFRGHQNANLDPLGLWDRSKVRELDFAHHDLDDVDKSKEFNVGSFAVGKEKMPLGELYSALKATYCGSIGAEYMHITNTDEKRWIQQRLESIQSQPSFDGNVKKRILKGLIAADGLENT